MNNLIKYTIITLLILLGTINVFGQSDNCPKTKNKKAKEHFISAQKIKNISRNEAEKYLLEAISIDSRYLDAHFLLGVVYFEKAKKFKQKNEISNSHFYYRKSIKKFKRVQKICESFNGYAASFYLGTIYYNQKQYFQSKKYFTEFIKQTKFFIERKEAELYMSKV